MDKYPELEEFSEQGQAGGDFLAREKALLGDEFGDAAPEAVSEPEAEPEVERESEADAAPAAPAGSHSEPKEHKGPELSGSSASSEPSAFLEEWKVKHQLEIERRDKASSEKQAEIRAKAQGSIDDFYANYNSKKEQSIAQVRKEAEQFVNDRDEQNKGSTWDKVANLIEEAKVAEGVKPVDKTRFKELVNGLKGDPDAPGAGGY